MSTDGMSRKQMINVELATKARNTAAKKLIEQRTPRDEQNELRLAFSCECSDPDCKARVQMTLTEYEKLHRSQAAFVLAKGHEQPVVEKVKQEKQNYTVVKKYAI